MPRLAATLTSVAAACILMQPSIAQDVVLTLDDGPCAVPLQANSSVTVDPATGNLTIDPDENNLPDCFGTPGGALDVTVTVTPQTIEAGETINVSWSVAGFLPGITTCNATGGTADWISDVGNSPSGGSGTYSPNGSTTYALSCQNAGGSDQVGVTVNGGGGGGGPVGADGFPAPPAFCGSTPTGRMLPFNIFQDFASNPPNGQPKRNYEEVWGEYPGSNEASVFIPVNQYVAMPFITNDEPGRIWSMTWVGGPSNGNATQVSVSRCPGDFSGIGYTDAACLSSSGSEGAVIGTIIGEGNACSLTSGEVYYLNVRHTIPSGANACNDGAICAFLGRPRRLN